MSTAFEIFVKLNQNKWQDVQTFKSGSSIDFRYQSNWPTNSVPGAKNSTNSCCNEDDLLVKKLIQTLSSYEDTDDPTCCEGIFLL